MVRLSILKDDAPRERLHRRLKDFCLFLGPAMHLIKAALSECEGRKRGRVFAQIQLLYDQYYDMLDDILSFKQVLCGILLGLSEGYCPVHLCLLRISFIAFFFEFI